MSLLLLPLPGPTSLSRSGAPPFRPLSTPANPRSFLRSSTIRAQNHHSLLLRFRSMPHGLGRGTRGGRIVCYSSTISHETLQWVCAVSSAALVLSKGTAIQKSFLVPLFALQAPRSVVSWIQSEYGGWTAFLALLVRLFFFLPGELELPLAAMLILAVAPYQAINLRGTQAGAIISLALAAYMALQHFSRAGSLQKAFDQGSIVATLAIICITVVPCFLIF